MVKNENFQCPSERGGPEDFKNHPNFDPSTIFGGVTASQTWEHFFWDTLYETQSTLPGASPLGTASASVGLFVLLFHPLVLPPNFPTLVLQFISLVLLLLTFLHLVLPSLQTDFQ